MNNSDNKEIINNLTQTLAKVTEVSQTEDHISFNFKDGEQIVPAIKDFTMLLDDVDTNNVMERVGLTGDEEDFEI